MGGGFFPLEVKCTRKWQSAVDYDALIQSGKERKQLSRLKNSEEQGTFSVTTCRALHKLKKQSWLESKTTSHTLID